MENLVTVIRKEDIIYKPLEGLENIQVEIALEIHPLSTSIDGGLARMKKCAFDWQIKYDEVIYVISGSMYIEENGVRSEAKLGDVLFMKEGANITYGTDDEVLFFFAVYPLNWIELNGHKLYPNTTDGLITLIKGKNINYVPTISPEFDAVLSSVIDHISTNMGGGIARMKNCAFEWDLNYDEIIYVISGSIYIKEGGKKFEAKQGDLFFIKKGARVTYGTEDTVGLFYAIYPLNNN